jgi:hypothetical protein
MFAHALWRDRHACVDCFVWLSRLNERASQRASSARDASQFPKRMPERFCGVIPVPINLNESLSIVDHVYCRRLAAQAVFQSVFSYFALYLSIYVLFFGTIRTQNGRMQ